MRIRELAKEIEVDNKDIIDVLESAGISGKTAASSVDDTQAEMVRAKLLKKAAPAPKAEAPKAEAPKAEAPKPAAAPKAPAASEAPKKKKPNIIFVSNPHNSQDRRGAYNGGARPQGNGNGANARPQTNAAPATQTARPQGRITTNVKPLAPGESRLLQEREQQAQANKVKGGETNKQAQQPQQKAQPQQQQPAVSEKPVAKVQENKPEVKAPVAPVNTGSNSTNSPKGNEEHKQEERPVRREKTFAGRPQVQTQDRRNQGRPNPAGSRDGGRDGSRDGRFSRDGRDGGRDGGSGNRQGGYNNQRSGSFSAPESNEPTKKTDQGRRHDNDKRNKEKTYQTEDGFRGGKNSKGGKQVKQLERPEKKVEVKEEEKIKVITLPETLTIKDLADKMKVQPAVIIKKLFLQGKVVTVNQEISYEQAEEIAVEFDILCEQEVVVDVIEELLKEEEEDEALMTKRPPVICVMGHVDHGKTSLLDAIRKTHVIDREAGGITQAIGAYVVNTKGQKITFLDTPGHEAFTAMRMRGANSTDIAILVVAADDGVMPQTVEAINHAKAAGIEIVVAVNKIDKPGANIERVKQELSEYNLIPEDWGGSTVFAPVSAKTGEGIDNLLDMILLTAEILELKANAKRRARGIVIEAELDKGRGPVATVLVQKGTLHVGDFIAAGACHGKVRAMIDDKGKRVKEAGPSTPVEILGLNDVPGAGEIFVSPENDKEAKNFAQTFIAQNKVKLLDDTKNKMSLDDLFSQIQAGNLKELNLIIKADVQGSVEAVKESLLKLTNEEIVVKCIHSGVGAINESDVILASASNAIIIGFNVRPDATAKATAETEGVDVRLYDVIYKAIEDVEAAMKGMLDPIFEEKVIGHAEIRQIFKASGIGNIAGSYVLDGVFQRNCMVRISHEGEQIYEGKLASLKRFKDDVKEVKTGFECGLVFDDFQNFTELDIVEAYIMVEVPR